MQRVLKITVVLMAVALVGGMIGQSKPEEFIVIGGVVPQTDPGAAEGTKIKYALEMAVDEFNDGEGILRREVKLIPSDELIPSDTKGKRKRAAIAIHELAARGVDVIILGGLSSSVAKVASVVADKYRIPFILTGAPADSFPKEQYDYGFRVVLAEDYRETDKAQQFNDAFQERFDTLPGPEAMATYHALMVLAKAIQIAGSTDGEAIVKALEEVKIVPPVVVIK